MHPESESTALGGSNRRGLLKRLMATAGGLLLTGKARPAEAEIWRPNGADPFLGEIMLVAFDFAPRGWAQCNGQLLPINQNAALFSLLGTQYGGNGTTTFALPDLRGRAPAHVGSSLFLTPGSRVGAETVTLFATQLPSHAHTLPVSSQPATAATLTAGSFLADNNSGLAQYATTPNATLNTSTAIAGGSQPHPNMQPYLVLNYVIALGGIYPSRN